MAQKAMGTGGEAIRARLEHRNEIALHGVQRGIADAIGMALA